MATTLTTVPAPLAELARAARAFSFILDNVFLAETELPFDRLLRGKLIL